MSLNYEYPPLGGGAGVVSEKLDKLYLQSGNSVLTLTAGIAKNCGVYQIGQRGIIRLKCGRRNRGFSNTGEKIGYVIVAIINCKNIIKSFKPDIVHCHFAIPTGFVAYYIKKMFKIPYIITSHGGDVPGFSPEETGKYFRYFNLIFKIIWRNADAVVTMSTGLAEMIQNVYHINPVVVPNGVSLTEYSASGKNTTGEVRLLFAGRFSAQKNLLFLIKSLGLVQNGNWKLYMIGDGPEKNNIREEINKKRLTNKIIMLDWKSKNELKQYLSESDILCLTSINEGLPIIGLEGLASGLAIMGVDTTGIHDIVDNSINGYLTEQDNQVEYANGISALIENYDLLESMKSASIHKAIDFDWNIVAGKYQNLIREYSN